MYANAPAALIKPDNVVSLCRLAHKYNCAELQAVCWRAIMRKLLKTATWDGRGKTPNLAELLVLGEQCSNDSLLQVVLGHASRFAGGSPSATPAVGPPPFMPAYSTCAVHFGEPLTDGLCYHRGPTCGPSAASIAAAAAIASAAEAADEGTKASDALLKKLSAETLVKLLRSLVAAIAIPPTARGRARTYY